MYIAVNMRGSFILHMIGLTDRVIVQVQKKIAFSGIYRRNSFSSLTQVVLKHFLSAIK